MDDEDAKRRRALGREKKEREAAPAGRAEAGDSDEA